MKLITHLIAFLLFITITGCKEKTNKQDSLPYKLQELTIKTGTKAWIVEDHSQPIVCVKLFFNGAGHIYDPQNKNGLANIVSKSLYKNVGSLNKHEVVKYKYELGINEFSVKPNGQYMKISFTVPSENLEKAFDFVVNAIINPKINPEKFKSAIYPEGSQVDLTPSKFLALQHLKFLLFPEHPYGKNESGNAEGIKNVQYSDVLQFIKERFAKNNVSAIFVGDITSENAINLLEKKFKSLPEKSAVFNDVPAIKAPIEKFQWIPKESPIAFISFGQVVDHQLGTRFETFLLLNMALTMGNVSKIEEALRKNGLSGSISHFLYRQKIADQFGAVFAVNPKEIKESIKTIKEVWNEVSKQGITKEEFEINKSSLLEGLKSGYESPVKLASFLEFMFESSDGIITDLQHLIDHVNSLTIEQVNSLAKEILNSDDLGFVVVGLPAEEETK